MKDPARLINHSTACCGHGSTQISHRNDQNKQHLMVIVEPHNRTIVGSVLACVHSLTLERRCFGSGSKTFLRGSFSALHSLVLIVLFSTTLL